MKKSSQEINFAIDKSEFGEIYHIGASMLVNSNVKAWLVYNQTEREIKIHNDFITNTLGLERRVNIISRVKCNCLNSIFPDHFSYLSETADIIVENQKFLKKICGTFLRGIIPEQENGVEKILIKRGIKKLDNKPLILVWIRQKKDHAPERNSTLPSLKRLKERFETDYNIAFIGSDIDGIEDVIRENEFNLVNFHKEEFFSQSNNSVALQLAIIKKLQQKYNCIAQLGMMSEAMDGPAITGLPTIWFAKSGTKRIDKLSGIEKKEDYKKQRPAITNFYKVEIKYYAGIKFVNFDDSELGEVENYLKKFKAIYK